MSEDQFFVHLKWEQKLYGDNGFGAKRMVWQTPAVQVKSLENGLAMLKHGGKARGTFGPEFASGGGKMLRAYMLEEICPDIAHTLEITLPDDGLPAGWIFAAWNQAPDQFNDAHTFANVRISSSTKRARDATVERCVKYFPLPELSETQGIR